jgi:hypothetical protein
MKLIGAEFGRLTMLVDAIDLGTRAGIYLPEAVLTVQQRYSFVHPPTLAPAAQQQQQQIYRFEQGRFHRKDKTYNVSAFEVHPFGLVVQGPDTDAAEAFFDDLFEMDSDYSWLKRPSRPPTKVFLSGLVVEFSKEVNQVLKKWNAVCALFSSQLKETYGIEQRVQVGSIHLKPDPQRIASRLSTLLGDFTLDRRLYEPYEHHRFYSMAPVRTDDHIALLENFEKIAL